MELEFLKAMHVFAALVKFELSDDICAFYVEAMRPYGLDKARQAIIMLSRSAKVGRGLPSVDDLVELVAPTEKSIEDGDNAAVVAGLIEAAMIRWGSTGAREGFVKQREHIGELGWAVVGPRWQHLCDTTTNKDLPALKAQWRGEIKGASARLRAGLLASPGLPQIDDGGQGRGLLPPAVQGAIDAASQTIVTPLSEEPPW